MPEFEKLTTFREYTIIQQLRVSAGQSDIYAVRKTEGGDDRPYLLKLYRFGSSMNEELLGQILSLGEKHPENLIRMYACGFDDNLERYFEVQEFIRYGSLNRIIAAMNDKNRDSVIRSVVGQVITGLETLHGNNILHLDLKPSNILIRSNKPFNLVLTDFGLSSIIDRDASKKVSSVNKGTDDYRAPEAYNGVYHKKTDYWSLGIIIYELLLGESPFAGKTPTEVTGTVLFKNIEISQKIEKSYIPLLKGLLIKDINSRWGYDEISRWLAGESVEYESETRYKNPYKFNKNEYYTLKELFNAFNSGDKNRQMAKMHISEGYLIKWLESEQDFDTAVEIKTIILENSNNYDAAFVDLLKKYDPGFKPETKDVPEEMSHIESPSGFGARLS